MAAIVSVAKLVDAEISSSANQEKLRVSVTMVVLQSMSSLPQRQLLPDPMTFRLKRQRRCFVLVLPCSTRLGVPEQDPEISSQSRVSEVWDIWGFNTRIGWGLSRWQWDEARTRSPSRSSAPAEELQKLGGARVVLATAPEAQSISALVGGLSANGKLLIVAAAMEPLAINALDLIARRRSIQGWPSGTAKDSEDTLRFSALTGVRPMIEKYPLSSVAEAYNQMITGKVRFRVVLTM
jgi:hypothetical protein